MENNKPNTNKTKKTGRSDEETGGKAVRVRRMRKGNTKTSEVRDTNSKTLFSERHTR